MSFTQRSVSFRRLCLTVRARVAGFPFFWGQAGLRLCQHTTNFLQSNPFARRLFVVAFAGAFVLYAFASTAAFGHLKKHCNDSRR